MQYLNSFTLASAEDEVDYLISSHTKPAMTCYSNHVYPFNLFPNKELRKLSFSQITLFYGGNGSGKSTLLNLIAEKLRLERSAPFNHTPFYDDYLSFCHAELTYGSKPPNGSKIITSDDVFDFLLDLRTLNDGVDREREKLFDEYRITHNEKFQLRSLDDLDELKRHLEARKGTKSSYVRRRLPQNTCEKSNGESAYTYFTQKIKENALYLLDEPENSLSAKLQTELLSFLTDSARFYNCQLIISTHSPFLLSMKGAQIYDLDSVPVCRKHWTELDSVRAYFNLFDSHRQEFTKE